MKNIVQISLGLILVLFLSVPSAKCQITAQNTVSESCSPGHDGVAEVILPNPSMASEYEFLWTFPGGRTEQYRKITGLTKGNYRIKVTPRHCPDKIIYESVVYVYQLDDCEELRVNITGETQVSSCDIPTVQLHANATGGTPPYRYFWHNRDTTVYTTVSGDGDFPVSCTVTDSEGKSVRDSKTVYLRQIDCSSDPNEIYGPEGYDDSLRYVAVKDKMNYTIRFENDPDFATAPASRVSITYPVPVNQNISSFRLADFGFGDFVFTVPSNSTAYNTRLDVSDSLGVWVDVTAGIDIVNHQLFWIFQSIDPSTGFEPASSQMGFLAINDSSERGEGYVSFLIEPKKGLHTGDTVSVDATIVFDDNAPIPTNVWHNTFDSEPPVSHLQAAISSEDSTYCTFSFTANDDNGGSGVNRVDLYVSQNDGLFEYYTSGSVDSTLRFSMQEGMLYKFMSIAVDNVGNAEPMKTIPDTTISTSQSPTDILLSKTYFYENDSLGTVVGVLSSLDNDITLPFTYELVSGSGDDDNQKFSIRGNRLITNGLYRCNNQFSYYVRIRTTNISGLSMEKEFEISKVQQNYPQEITILRQICEMDSIQFGNRMLGTVGIYTDSLYSTKGCDSVVTLNLNVLPVYNKIDTIVACDSLRWHDSTYTVITSEPTKHFYTVNGCDSIVTLNLTLNHSTIGTDIQTACDSYTWIDEITYHSSTNSPVDTIQNIMGCDSVVTLNLTIHNPVHLATTDTACETYTWNGTTYTASGIYTYSHLDAHGCTQVDTLHLTINNPVHLSTTDTACETYTWNNTPYTASGTYTNSHFDANGCTQVDTLNLTIHNNNTGIETVSECNSFIWHGTEYFVSTNTPTYTTTNAAGCDSVVTLDLTINYSTTDDTFAVACDSFTWWHTDFTGNTDNATHVLTNTAGCDSVVTLHLTVNHSSTGVETVTACNSYFWHGVEFTALTDTPTHTFVNAAGCDSVVTLDLTVNYSTEGDTFAVACDSFYWRGVTYFADMHEASPYTTINSVGCDSVVTLHLTVNNSNTGIETVTACNSYVWHGIEYAASTDTATFTSTNVAGCDSVTTLNLTINHCSTTTITTCDSYTWHGTNYTLSGVYYDGTDTLNLTVNYSNTGIETVTACDSYTWHGTNYTASTNTSTFTETNAAGCDSVVMLNLTINYSTTGDTFAVACDSFTWHGTNYTTAGTQLATMTNAAGCDSLVTLHLTVNYSNTGVEEVTACNSYVWHGTEYTASTNMPTYTSTNVAGCDSVTTLHLTINHCSTTTITDCDSYIWYGTNYTQSGIYYDGTDTLVLTINYSNTGVETVTACDNYTWHGSNYTTSTNTPTFTETNASGCDSVVTLHLTVNYSNTGVETVTACDSFAWWNTNYTNSTNTATHTYTNVAGCDSIVTLNLTINHSSTSDTTATACDSFYWRGTTYFADMHEASPYMTINSVGCDSLVTLHLTVNHSTTGDTFAVACDSFTWHGICYTTAGTQLATMTNAAGCDSVVTLHLTMNYSNTGVETVTACDSFIWWNTNYTNSTNTPTHTFINAAGCDSVVTLNLTINYSTTGDTFAVACDSLYWHGTSYTTAGTQLATMTNAAGCDSVVTLNLTINYSSTGDTFAVACDSFYWRGVTYYADMHEASPYMTLNSLGCDSLVTLHLTVNYSSTGDTFAVACDSFYWRGVTYYADMHQASPYMTINSVGCDSLVTLHLTVNHSVTVYDSLTLASDDLPYNYYGNTVNNAGDYTFDGTTAEGCDSTTLLHVEVLEDIDLSGPLADLKVFPNPTRGTLTIDADDVVKVEVFDITGRKIATFEGVNTFDITNLSAGTYTLRIETTHGKTVRRIVKK